MPAVAAAEQKDEPLQVTVRFVQAVGGVADELGRDAARRAITVQPLAEKLPHLGQFGCVGGVELDVIGQDPGTAQR